MTARAGAGVEGTILHIAGTLEDRKSVLIQAADGFEGVTDTLEQEVAARVGDCQVHDVTSGTELLVVSGSVGVRDGCDIRVESLRDITNVFTQNQQSLSCVGSVERPRLPSTSVAGHAEVGPIRDVDGGPELGIVGRAVGIVANHTGDSSQLAIAFLQVFGVDAEGLLEGRLTLMATSARTPSSSVFRVGTSTVSGLGPLLYEGVVASVVALPTPVLCIGGRLERS
jgi:hypothetical protein